MNIKSAIFDMDGTLVDSLMLWDVLWSTFGERYLGDKGFRPSVDDDKKVRTLTLKDAMELIHRNYDLGESGQELLDLANSIMIDFYGSRVELKNGVREFLEFCRQNGVKMCIASATNPDLVESALEHCGIRCYFDTVFSCGVLGKGKDTPDIYLMATEYLGEDMAHTWVFEDAYVAIRTATGIGMQTVGIYDVYNPYQDEIKAMATHYIGPGETLMKLV